MVRRVNYYIIHIRMTQNYICTWYYFIRVAFVQNEKALDMSAGGPIEVCGHELTVHLKVA